MANANGKTFTPTAKKPLGIFGNRRQIPDVLNWRLVSNLALRTALSTALASGATVSFVPGNAGTGVTVKIWQGEGGDTAFAGTATQMTELLALIVDKYASSSEDPWQAHAIQGETGTRPS